MATQNPVPGAFWLPLRFPFSVALETSPYKVEPDGESAGECTWRKDAYAAMLFVIICPACETIRSVTPSDTGVIYAPAAEICPKCGVNSIPLPLND